MNEERKELWEKMHDILFGKIFYNQHGRHFVIEDLILIL